MAPFVDVSLATNQDVDVVPAVPAAQSEQQNLNAAIAAAIKQNRKEISKVARRAKVEVEDAIQETFLLLHSYPQLLHCEFEEMSCALFRKLRMYKYPPYDALARAKSTEAIALAQKCNSDEVLSEPKDTQVERWCIDEPQGEVIDSLAMMVSKRPSGQETALRVLRGHLEGVARSNTEVAELVGISPRRVQQIVEQIEDAAWSMH